MSVNTGRRNYLRNAALAGSALVIGGVLGYGLSQGKTAEGEGPTLEQKAPDFSLPSTLDRNISLGDYSGKYVLLFFYPEDFTPVCSTEVPEFNKHIDEFEELETQVLGVSVQDVQSHKNWITELGGLSYPLLADVTKEVSRRYRVLRHDGTVSLRGTFIIDPDGILQFMNIHNMDVGRSVKEIIRVLQAIQTGELCPVEFQVENTTQT